MRRRSTLFPLTVVLAIIFVYILYNRSSLPPFLPGNTSHYKPVDPNLPPAKGPEPDFPLPSLAPLSGASVEIDSSSHPVRALVSKATKEFDDLVAKQSSTLAEAVAEYKRRNNGLAPPPNFDKWFTMAKERGVVLTDEYDSITDMLRPFWAIKPETIRARAREALGFDNFLIGVLVRDGKVTSSVDGWQAESTVGMMKSFVKWLPDMDLAFNTHDEPRVIIPHDDLDRMVRAAKEKVEKTGRGQQSVANEWSKRPSDLDYSKQAPEIRTTRFNRFAHQATWTHSRLSCPPDSPARSLAEDMTDETAAYTYSELSLVQNHTAFSDICNSPSLRNTYGFFDRPNSFDIVHDLFPIFSQSKISSFSDILYPSPWYWVDKVPYKPEQDTSWASKINKLYWRGSTTGGFSRDGGWRRQHRQQVVRNVNAADRVRVFEKKADGTSLKLVEAPRKDSEELFDVHFSHIGQCDPGDCSAQETFFGLAPQAPQEGAWKYKYLLDIDGNAFSGRFYAFLQSMSAVFKMAVFREWHDGDGWIRPWVHYIPLSLSGHEYVEVMRYFDGDAEGQKLISQVADRGRDWAAKAIRNADLEVWFFRLLLEYGRLVDDNREHIGFTTA